MQAYTMARFKSTSACFCDTATRSIAKLLQYLISDCGTKSINVCISIIDVTSLQLQSIRHVLQEAVRVDNTGCLCGTRWWKDWEQLPSTLEWLFVVTDTRAQRILSRWKKTQFNYKWCIKAIAWIFSAGRSTKILLRKGLDKRKLTSKNWNYCITIK